MDLEAKLPSSQTIQPWLIEYAAQTQWFWSKSEDDGVTESGESPFRQRGPGSENESCTSCRKDVKISKSEARWRQGVLIGSNEASDEHLSGTPLGVIKARAVVALPDGQRFKGKAIDGMQGTPWRPSAKHRRIKI